MIKLSSLYNNGFSPFIEKLAQKPNAFFQFILKEPPVKEAVSSTYLTKCYNTATTLLYLLTLDKTSLDKADVICHEQLYRNPLKKTEKITKLQKLKIDLAKKEKGIVLYYILMNVGDMDCKDRGNNNNNNDYNIFSQFSKTKTFPGHVFIVEKVNLVDSKGGSEIKYYLYQSYINKYTLKDYYHQNGNSFEIKKDVLLSYIDNMIELFNQEKWSAKTSKFWKDFTLVDSSEFDKCDFTTVKPCYLRFKMKDINFVLKNYDKYLRKKLGEINDDIKASKFNKYNLKFNTERNQYSNKTESAMSESIKSLREYIGNLLKEIREISYKVNNNNGSLHLKNTKNLLNNKNKKLLYI